MDCTPLGMWHFDVFTELPWRMNHSLMRSEADQNCPTVHGCLLTKAYLLTFQSPLSTYVVDSKTGT